VLLGRNWLIGESCGVYRTGGWLPRCGVGGWLSCGEQLNDRKLGRKVEGKRERGKQFRQERAQRYLCRVGRGVGVRCGSSG